MGIDNLGRLTLYLFNLYVEDGKIFSYKTHVADIDHKKGMVTKLGYWSSTTSKHINYVAKELGYETEIQDET